VAAGQEAQESIAALVAQSDELQTLVDTLEQQYDAFVAARGSQTLTTADLPTADELGAELERFLAEQTRRRDDRDS